MLRATCVWSRAAYLLALVEVCKKEEQIQGSALLSPLSTGTPEETREYAASDAQGCKKTKHETREISMSKLSVERSSE